MVDTLLPVIISRNLVIHANFTLLVIIFISSKQIDPSSCDRRVIFQYSIPRIKKIHYNTRCISQKPVIFCIRCIYSYFI